MKKYTIQNSCKGQTSTDLDQLIHFCRCTKFLIDRLFRIVDVSRWSVTDRVKMNPVENHRRKPVHPKSTGTFVLPFVVILVLCTYIVRDCVCSTPIVDREGTTFIGVHLCLVSIQHTYCCSYLHLHVAKIDMKL